MLTLSAPSTTVTLSYLIYFQSTLAPTIDTLRLLYRCWVDKHTYGVLHTALESSLALMPILELGLPDQFPKICPCSCSQDCIELTRRAREASHVCLVHQTYRPGWPHAGYWSVLGAASAMADALNGMIVDPVVNARIHPFTGRSDGVLSANEHIRIVSSIDERSRGWTTTSGLDHFGMRELEFIQVPPRILGEIAGLANPLADLALALVPSAGLPEEFDFHPPQAIGSTRIRLQPSPRSGLVTVRPPASNKQRSLSRWYYRMLTDLFGPEPQ